MKSSDKSYQTQKNFSNECSLTGIQYSAKHGFKIYILCHAHNHNFNSTEDTNDEKGVDVFVLSLPSLPLPFTLLIVYITFADILKRLESRLTTTLVHEDPSRGLKLVETARLPLCKDRMLLL